MRLDCLSRMHEDIMRWSSEALYSGKLVAAPSVATRRLEHLAGVLPTEDTSPVLVLVDTAGCGLEESTAPDSISRCNPGEAALVCRQVARLLEAGVPEADIAVITPYNLQVTAESSSTLCRRWSCCGPTCGPSTRRWR